MRLCINFLYLKKKSLIKDKENFWKYSISSLKKYNSTAYYFCSDTAFNGRGLIKYDTALDSEYEKIKTGKEKFVLTKEHSKIYEEHSYNKYI